MAAIARSWDQVMAREYTSRGTPQQQWADALGMASAIYNRSVALGVDYNTVVQNKNEFNGYMNRLQPGDYARIELAKKAMAEVEANGPVHTGMFFATPRAVNGLPPGLVDTGYAVENGHVYKEDPRAGAIAVKGGKFVKPDIQALQQEIALKGVTLPTPQMRPADVPLGVPVPQVNPMSTVDAVAAALSAPLAASAAVPAIGVAQPANATPDASSFDMERMAPQPSTANFDPGRFSQPSAPAEFDPGRLASGYQPNMGPAMVDLSSALTGAAPVATGPDTANFDPGRFGPAPISAQASAPVDPMQAVTEGPYTANGLTNSSGSLEVPAVAVPVTSVAPNSFTQDLTGISSPVAPPEITRSVPTLSVNPTAAAATPMADPGGYDMNARRDYENSPAGITEGIVQNEIARNAQAEAAKAAVNNAATANIASDNAVRSAAPAAKPAIDVTGTSTATQGTPVTGDLADAYTKGYQQAAEGTRATFTDGTLTNQDRYGNPALYGPSLIGATQTIKGQVADVDGTMRTVPASISVPAAEVGSPPTSEYDPATNRMTGPAVVKPTTTTVTPPTTDYVDPMVSTENQPATTNDTGATETSGLPVPPADVGTPTVTSPASISSAPSISGDIGSGIFGFSGNNLGATPRSTSPDTDNMGRMTDAVFSGRTAGTLGGALLGLALAGGNPLGLMAGSLLGGLAGQSLLGDQQPDESPLGALFGMLTGSPPGSRNGTGGYGGMGQGGSLGPGSGPSGSTAAGGRR